MTGAGGPAWDAGRVTVWAGDSMGVLAGMPDGCVDAVVTDPPYGLADLPAAAVAATVAAWVSGDRAATPAGRGFVGEAWDGFVPPPAVFDQVFRVLKPGGHLLCFASPRTQDLMGLSVRLAGFEIRDSVAWLRGDGFPKSQDVSATLHRAGRADAGRWSGWGTGLKPGHEPVLMARRPVRGSVAANMARYGVGGLHVDACRVGDGAGSQGPRPREEPSGSRRYTARGGVPFAATPGPRGGDPSGRFPCDVVLDEAAAREVDRQAPETGAGGPASGPTQTGPSTSASMAGGFSGTDRPPAFYGDRGGASRFFAVIPDGDRDVQAGFRYVPKAPRTERPVVDGVAHPTVKPVGLVRWLCRLVCPPGGVVLDPTFMRKSSVSRGSSHYGPAVSPRVRARRPYGVAA